MRRILISLALATSALVTAAPGQAATVANGASGVMPTAGVPAGQGTLLASNSFSGQALTFAATFNQAVYLNSSGTLDFYYQVLRTGIGSQGDNEEIARFTVSNFAGFTVDGYASGPDADGSGTVFVAAANPTDGLGNPSGSTTTFARNAAGNVLTTNFGLNGLMGTENSATYIFRTNATAYNFLGSFGVLDGSSLQGAAFQPTAVPEPASWAMLLIGFAAAGATLRRRTKVQVRYA